LRKCGKTRIRNWKSVTIAKDIAIEIEQHALVNFYVWGVFFLKIKLR
jgi:hypothetical protein